jgi:hypothetical protein
MSKKDETHLNRIEKLQQEVKATICEMIDMSGDTYDIMQHTDACTFLLSRSNQAKLAHLLSSSRFWAWWGILYASTGNAFLEAIRYNEQSGQHCISVPSCAEPVAIQLSDKRQIVNHYATYLSRSTNFITTEFLLTLKDKA